MLQPLYERSQLKMRRVLPAGLFVAPLVFSSTGVFLETTLRPLVSFSTTPEWPTTIVAMLQPDVDTVPVLSSPRTIQFSARRSWNNAYRMT